MSAEARWQLLEHVGPEALLQLGDAPKHGGVVQPEAPDDGPTRDGKKVANVIPVDHPADCRSYAQKRVRTGSI
jgi:hypothetical protein